MISEIRQVFPSLVTLLLIISAETAGTKLKKRKTTMVWAVGCGYVCSSVVCCNKIMTTVTYNVLRLTFCIYSTVQSWSL